MKNRTEIVISGHLTSNWTSIFEGLEITCQPDGNTLITGELPDQSALYGLLNQFRDFGFTLLSINSFSTQEGK
jgi:hypothetical protein